MKYSLESLRLQVAKNKKKLKKDLAEVKKKYPLVYLAYLVSSATTAQLASDAIVGTLVFHEPSPVAEKIAVQHQNCRRRYDRDAGRATNAEEAGEAIVTYLKCMFG